MSGTENIINLFLNALPPPIVSELIKKVKTK